MIKHGVLTVESKSGYGLDKENELKQLRVSNRLAEKYNLNMKHTFLGSMQCLKKLNLMKRS